MRQKLMLQRYYNMRKENFRIQSVFSEEKVSLGK